MALALGMHGTHLFADAINPGRHSNLIPSSLASVPTSTRPPPPSAA